MHIHVVDVTNPDLSLFDEPELPKLADLVSRAWPDGMSAEDIDAIARLSRVSHRKLRIRLAAMLDMSRSNAPDGQPLAVQQAARAAGLGVSQFHLLAARWRRGERSVAALGLRPPGSRRGRRVEATGGSAEERKVDRQRLDEAVLAIVTRNPKSTVNQVRDLLADELAEEVAPLTLRRAVEAARRDGPGGCFGRRVVLDSAGLDLVDHEGDRLRLFAAIDPDALIALSWIIGTEESMSMGFVWTAAMVGDMLPEGIERVTPCKDAPVLDIRFNPRDAEGRQLLEETLRLAPPPRSTYARIPGKAVLEALGERLDRIWLGTGSRDPGVGFRTGRNEHLPLITAPIADGIDAAIRAHNLRRIDRMTAADIVSGNGGADRVAEVKTLLASVENLFDRVMALPSYASVPGDFDWMPRSSRTTS